MFSFISIFRKMDFIKHIWINDETSVICQKKKKEREKFIVIFFFFYGNINHLCFSRIFAIWDKKIQGCSLYLKNLICEIIKIICHDGEETDLIRNSNLLKNYKKERTRETSKREWMYKSITYSSCFYGGTTDNDHRHFRLQLLMPLF